MVSFFRILLIGILLLVGGLVCTGSTFATMNEGELEIRYFHLEADKKSGDAIFLKSPDGKTMLIDSGSLRTGKQLVTKLQTLGISSVDYAVATHPHHDHIGGFVNVMETVSIGHLLLPKLTHSTKAYAAFVKRVKEKDIGVSYIREGDRFNLGNDVEIEVLHPSENEVTKSVKEEELSTTDINNLSVVLKVTYNDNTFLFTSDIYKDQEKQLMKKHQLSADVLHAPHHGGGTSSSSDFIEAVDPTYTIISTNKLPRKSIVSRYVRKGSKVYATSVNGSILLQSNGKTIKVVTEKKQD
ncbi:MBL fold metallo-hydrolase [Alkalihalobacillus sp. MEB130]|uniref:ComEC/Rec2 family competence protein n=1 Tax=Alkalihalobacillus sp. MEB130 TaxID=2976704 RepID=UPI0028DD5B30|nr:MBL fold metallo-hydrolase [Alkalihalobacillus sp. MEB130]MDT8862401.1 MBL fold metallo-hydrolase [Alkalihalobacillus sp. MEB130]